MTPAERVRTELSDVAMKTNGLGVTIPALSGKLLRPLTAFSFVPAKQQVSLNEQFWLGCLAIQMVHEASLHHDDVLDHGLERRNQATLLARKGTSAALLMGDLYLTSAYRIAALTGLNEFLNEFIHAVADMVQGESIQDHPVTNEDHAANYEAIVRKKSGALFGIAAALPGWTGHADSNPAVLRNIGIELGVFYQMVDDFLDYCPDGDTGKPKLQDFNNHIWTFVLGNRGTDWFAQSPHEALDEFFRGPDPPSMAALALAQVKERGARLLDQMYPAGAESPLIDIIKQWMDCCTRAFEAGNHRCQADPDPQYSYQT